MQDDWLSMVPEQDTLPLNTIAISHALAFSAYLNLHHLEPLEVSVVSHVRYISIWNVQHGNPIRKEHAALIRQGLQRLTGVPFTSPIETRE